MTRFFSEGHLGLRSERSCKNCARHRYDRTLTADRQGMVRPLENEARAHVFFAPSSWGAPLGALKFIGRTRQGVAED